MKIDVDGYVSSLGLTPRQARMFREMLINHDKQLSDALRVIQEFKKLRSFFHKESPLTKMFDKIISENNI